MIVIGYWPSSEGVISDSRGNALPVEELGEVLEMLLEPYKQQGEGTQVWKMAWDIDDLVIPILKLLPPDQLRILGETERCEFYVDLKDGGIKRIRLFYPRSQGIGLCFSINDKSSGNEVVIWHLGSFVPDGVESPKDAVEVEMYARKILGIFAKQLGYEPVPGYFFSPVNVVRPYISRMSLPRIEELPPKVANYASKCMAPPFVEAVQIGHFPNTTDVDLKNAYAGVLSRLPDWRLGQFTEGKEYEPKAMLGYCCCDLEISKDVKLHPILTEVEDSTEGMVISATGTQKGKYLTKGQIDFIRHFKIGEVSILDGVWWFPQEGKQLRQPLKTVIDRLTRKREELTKQEKEVDRLLGRFEAKKILTGLWGLTAEWRWEESKDPGDFYNPIWAAEITTRIAMRVAAFAYRKKLIDHIIHIAVDGFTTDCPVVLTPEEESSGWKTEDVGESLCLSKDFSWLSNKKPGGLYLKDVLQMIRANPKNNLWSRKYHRRATLGDALQRGDLNLMGRTINCSSTVTLDQQHNRHFARLPKDGQSLLSKRYRSKLIELKEA